MVSERFDLFLEPVTVEVFDGRDDTPVEELAALLQKTAISYLVGQRVLKRVLQVGKQLRLVEELGRLQTGEKAAEVRLRQIGDRLKEGKGYVLTDDSGRLEQSLVLQGQAVDPSREDSLDSCRHLDVFYRCLEPIGTLLADQGTGLDQDAHAFLQEERVPFSPFEQQPL